MEKLLAKAGDILNVAKSDGFTTLHIAAINDHREIAKILLQQVSSLFVLPECTKTVFGKKKEKKISRLEISGIIFQFLFPVRNLNLRVQRQTFCYSQN